jgi:pyruvate dehydrogenase E2 component (dihydrolipoamide acetyltransferase)
LPRIEAELGSAALAANAAAVARPAIAFVARGDHGPPVILLRGFGADRMSWAIAQAGLAQFAATIAVDLPAHGESGNEVGDGSIAHLTDVVAGFLQSQYAAPLHLIGHSLGGAVAIDLAHRSPDRVASLVLIAPAGLGRAIDHAFLADFMSIESVDQAHRVLERLVTRPRLINRQMAARVLDRLSQPGAREGLRKIATALAGVSDALAPAIASISRSSLPRIVVWGEEDHINPIDEERITAFARNPTLLPATGHMPQVENAGKIEMLLRSFYRELGLS